MNDSNRERRLEISMKLLQMGRSLVEEGEKLEDDDIMQAGGTLVLTSGLILNSDDMKMFNYVCSMFTSKQILDEMMNSPMGGMLRATSMGGLDKIEDILKSMSEKPKNDEGSKLGDNLSD